MKLYTHPISTPALGVLMTANALGLEYETHVVNLQTAKARRTIQHSVIGWIQKLAGG